jgi:hypothetical protein
MGDLQEACMESRGCEPSKGGGLAIAEKAVTADTFSVKVSDQLICFLGLG